MSHKQQITITASNDGGNFHGVAKYKTIDKGKDGKKKIAIEDKSIELLIDEKAFIPCFSFKWPYVCFESIISNHIMIINCEDHDVIHNVEIGANVDKFIDTFITEQNELFVMTRKKDDYMLFKINLDLSRLDKNYSNYDRKIYQPFRPFEVLRYKAKDVDHKKLFHIWIRGSS